MTYGYDGYTYNNTVGLTRIVMNGYKTKAGIKKALSRRLERQKVILNGFVLYSFNGGEEQKYNPKAYTILDQFNHKAFFEYWR